ncbi:S-adenosyl-L-methionine-dependent methyltransferase [Pluteus cervinus]|uniref:S-adenosyl-L-methionine-dependent methyltransferase n=1 Tax=Pluteus cervinus TaxID=181527 RepID=A0ACD3BF65_9AGAR|nr:S-adenosyl-L-methionine-dependent methyltransferase [Pluteus cervinus]
MQDVVGDDAHLFFRFAHGRHLNSLNQNYLLPADKEEIRRSELHHRMLQFVFSGKNYIGPVRQALQFGEQRRILDLGTGGGFWAIDMADEFPRAEVIGVDLAPIQPRDVPPNCTFELCDLDQWNIPYPDNYFDFVHARSMHTGIHDYPRFIEEIARILRPGGLVLIIEPSLHPLVGPIPTATAVPAMPLTQPSESYHDGWETLWETYRTCLRRHGIDVTVPERLADLLAEAGEFEDIVTSEGNIPVGFWPPESDSTARTVGELQWMDYELFLPALKPFFLSLGLADTFVDNLISEAQRDFYEPPPHICRIARLHIVYASKVL